MRDDDDPNLKDPEAKPDVPGVSRRDFLKISGMSIALPLVADSTTAMAAGQRIDRVVQPPLLGRRQTDAQGRHRGVSSAAGDRAVALSAER